MIVFMLAWVATIHCDRLQHLPKEQEPPHCFGIIWFQMDWFNLSILLWTKVSILFSLQHCMRKIPTRIPNKGKFFYWIYVADVLLFTTLLLWIAMFYCNSLNVPSMPCCQTFGKVLTFSLEKHTTSMWSFSHATTSFNQLWDFWKSSDYHDHGHHGHNIPQNANPSTQISFTTWWDHLYSFIWFQVMNI